MNKKRPTISRDNQRKMASESSLLTVLVEHKAKRKGNATVPKAIQVFSQSSPPQRHVRLQHDDSTVTSGASVSSYLSAKVKGLRRKLTKTDRRSMGTMFASARRAFWKKARAYSHQKVRHDGNNDELVFFWSSAAQAIYACVGMSLLCHDAIFLYGIVLVLWAQVAWVALRWTLYIWDDPELHSAMVFIRGWLALVKRQGEAIIANKSSRALWFAAMWAREIPQGISLTRAFLRKETEKINKQRLAELRYDIDIRKRLNRSTAA